MRIPGSVNIKPGKNNFVSTITEWHPDRFWELDDLAVQLGVDLDNLHVRAPVSISTVGSVVENPVEDPLLDWLHDNGHVVRDNGGQWVEIRCPWADNHTTGGDTVGYSAALARCEWVARASRF